MPDDGDDDERLRREEKLRFVGAERAEAEERADESELGETDRAGRGGDDRADAAGLFEPGSQAQTMQSRIIRSKVDVASADGVTMA